MTFRFIGSTGILIGNQCQNDIWLTQGNPAAPVANDTRVIIQVNSLIAGSGFLYLETFNAAFNNWEVIPMLQHLLVIDVTANPNVPLVGVGIPPALFANPLVAPNATSLPGIITSLWQQTNLQDFCTTFNTGSESYMTSTSSPV